MRTLGITLLTIGFFAAAFISVRHSDTEQLEWQTIEWGWYIASFLIGTMGVILMRVSATSSITQSHKLDSDLSTIETSLNKLIDKLTLYNQSRDSINVYDVHQKIDDDLMEDLNAFVDARESLIHLYDLQSYANLMNEFAGSERNINRAWSASADGYIDEVWICLEHALEKMKAARTLLRQYQQNQDPGFQQEIPVISS